jgi:aspartyl aminopeptidase
MNWCSEDLHKEYVTLKTHRYGGCFKQWQDEKLGRHNIFRLLSRRNLLEISLSSRESKGGVVSKVSPTAIGYPFP